MAGKRHRWGEPVFVADDLKRWDCVCGARRYKQPDEGPWFNVPTGDGRFRFVGSRVPPCPGRPEEKKP